MNEKTLNSTPYLFFFLTLAFYAGLIVYFDNTNITTANGLDKAIYVLGWETGTRFIVDSGGLLYCFMMGMIAKFIPDAFVSFYGTVAGFITHRKLAFIHAGFGAAASTAVFLLAYQVTRDRAWSIVVALVHTVSAFILVNSITSEDIMPGYFFFVLSFLFFYQAMTTSYKRLYLTGTTLCVLAALFLHWTLFPPMVCTYGLLVLWLLKNKDISIRLIIEQLLLFNALILAFVAMANTLVGSHFNNKLSFFQVLYPKKAGPGSWVGLSWHKIESLYLGVGNFLVGCQNVLTFSAMPTSNLGRTIVSWIVTIFCLGVVSRFLRQARPVEQKVLAGFGVGVFVFGQLQNMYGQPQDPQFQVQPMFIITLGLILLYFCQQWRGVLKVGLGVCSFLIGMDNFLMMKPLRGGDSQAVIGYQEFRHHFPKDHIKLIHLAYEGWSPWLMLFDYQGDFKTYLKDITCLNTPFHLYPGISASEGAQKIIDEIDKALAAGKKVIATTPWVDPSYIDVLQSQNLSQAQIKELKTILLQRYRVKQIYKVSWGHFAELERNPDIHG